MTSQALDTIACFEQAMCGILKLNHGISMGF
jgi:hypothetical protein